MYVGAPYVTWYHRRPEEGVTSPKTVSCPVGAAN